MAKRPRAPKTQKEIATGIPSTHNRAYDVRRDNDNVRDFKVQLQDIDSAILFYLDNIVLPTLKDNNESIKIPVYYGSPERWKSAQEDGFFKDKDGKTQVPVIIFRRTGLAKNRELTNKVDANYPQLYQSFKKNWSRKTAYCHFSKVNNISPAYEQYNVIVPDYVNLTYEFIIWTDFVDQMNTIIEAINYSEGTYWGDPEKFKFRVKIDDYVNQTDLTGDTDRLVRTTFTLILSGYIISDTLNKEIADTTRKLYTNFILRFGQDVENVNELTDSAAVPITGNIATPTGGSSANASSLSIAVSQYLALNISKTSDSISGNTAIFYDSYIATAPYPLEATTKDNFIFSINGQVVPPAVITSFSQVGSTVEITFDATALGYSLSASDKIVATGKFNPNSDTSL